MFLHRVPLTVGATSLAMAAFMFAPLERCFTINLAAPSDIALHQLLGCHLLHWSTEHLLWDVGMFVVLGGLCEWWWPRRTYLVLAMSAVTIPLLVLSLQPQITSYRGLSGIDTALFGLLGTTLLISSWRSGDWATASLLGGLLMALAAKILYEFTTAELLFVSEVNFVPLPLAHLSGGVIGALVGSWPERWHRRQRSLQMRFAGHGYCSSEIAGINPHERGAETDHRKRRSGGGETT